MCKLGVTLLASVTCAATAMTLGLSGCAPARGALPPDARLDILQTDKLVLRGTAPPHTAGASCASSPRDATTRYLQLDEDTTANFVLRPTGGIAVLHVEALANDKTWCVMARAAGTGATIPGEFPAGIYAITVEGSHSSAPTPYAVVVERL